MIIILMRILRGVKSELLKKFRKLGKLNWKLCSLYISVELIEKKKFYFLIKM